MTKLSIACPECGHEAHVVGSKIYSDGHFRRLKCKTCGYKWREPYEDKGTVLFGENRMLPSTAKTFARWVEEARKQVGDT